MLAINLYQHPLNIIATIYQHLSYREYVVKLWDWVACGLVADKMGRICRFLPHKIPTCSPSPFCKPAPRIAPNREMMGDRGEDGNGRTAATSLAYCDLAITNERAGGRKFKFPTAQRGMNRRGRGCRKRSFSTLCHEQVLRGWVNL